MDVCETKYCAECNVTSDNSDIYFCQRCDAHFCEQHMYTHTKTFICVTCCRITCIELLSENNGFVDIIENQCFNCKVRLSLQKINNQLEQMI